MCLEKSRTKFILILYDKKKHQKCFGKTKKSYEKRKCILKSTEWEEGLFECIFNVLK